MPHARIIATKVHIQDLIPGDLYSEHGPEYWNRVMSGHVQAEARIWPNAAVDPSDETVYRLTIVQEGERDKHVMHKGLSPFAPPGTAVGEI